MPVNVEANQDLTATQASSRSLWTGRVLTALAVLFLVFDGVTKVLKVPAVMQASAQMQYPLHLIPVIGIILLVCTAVYAIPQTSILGAILLTGYLGGAVEAQLRVGNPLFSETLFPIYFAVVVWAGLFLRERRLRALIPFRS
jgi:hypothetical protein